MARDMYGPMTGASAWMMTVTWDAPRLLLLWAMWAAMMAGMMLPTITPMLLLYARAMRNRATAPQRRRARIYAMAGGLCGGVGAVQRRRHRVAAMARVTVRS